MLVVPTRVELVPWGSLAEASTRASWWSAADAKLQTQGVHHITINGANRQTSIDFWEGVLGMPFVFEQPNLDNAGESHLYFDPGDGRLITVFTNEEREPEQKSAPREPGIVHHLAFALSQATFAQTVERLDERGIEHSGVKDRGFMDSIYFEDPLGLLVELASYRFEPPHGHTHTDVLLEAHKLRVERGDPNIDRDPPRRRDRAPRHALAGASRTTAHRKIRTEGGVMATHTLSILKPSVNNLTVRIFVRAAGLDFEEIDVWGKKSTPDFLAKDPADLTPLLEEEGLPKGSLWESCAIMQYLCNKHGLDRFYSTDPGERAMVDSAMFYLIGTFYPLLARATYPALRFGQYAGEVATAEVSDELKEQARTDAETALAGPLETFNAFFLAGRSFVGGDEPSIADIRWAATLEFLRAIDYDFPAWADEFLGAHGGGARRGLLGARGRRPGLHRVRQVGGGRELGAERASRWSSIASSAAPLTPIRGLPPTSFAEARTVRLREVEPSHRDRRRRRP